MNLDGDGPIGSVDEVLRRARATAATQRLERLVEAARENRWVPFDAVRNDTIKPGPKVLHGVRVALLGLVVASSACGGRNSSFEVKTEATAHAASAVWTRT